ncbi:Crp/Fnr family transcriptional regulator [Tenacibaculum sp. Bg11-29]|uniref:Crp/Fnr family transcriptional regulator n=1 Tax=Tenacibaculum sp. Bg11-29 TaxID=2058306 RepID=UPI000C3407DE|nr:Crp/Fnr family transcriptional regulator [Tenacibaculum sp. Bg11-29]PKH50027.1 Crp/Fnr family transcriptional regulator [Tenacibaculum sp. Bg11-29]
MNFSNYIENIIESQEFDSQISEIFSFFKPLQLTKNNFLVEKGKICEYFCFIENGVLQHSIEVSEEERTTYLALKNSCTAALKSYLQKTPSRKSIKALSNCNLQVILVADFKHLLKTNKVFQQFYYTLIEKQIFLIDDYRIDLLTLTPEDRYKKLLLNEPNLLGEVPLRYLASFLGISTRHMSRIRKNIK